ncbi:wax ester/triacylglycerol synthase family O-acyltransferase [Mycobacterium heidelbergense]|uniref:Diacylglycerol O-acyltransferase n=1 Tax=Mycobacterium heidelbergense TaxID=53376 RepID=A0A1X0DMY7_MYCHE|nr:wax ester/triacylglycerol synthase family O-acyltransferase [Mycobacterium heidelbergense]MCV7049294.1 wax ester/triacylglycerol synthase family O-acyltransferase [Mycobacterium heidelbergense]ORA73756.1 diacylglycerol O-acyltransferase [Mycobacterium heidelbergense]
MDQLTILDAGFLKAEDSDRHVSLAIGGLAVIEGLIPDRDALMSTLEQRIRACPRFGQRLRMRPLDLGAPEWVDDPGFDLARHVRHIALPRPGDDRELFQLAADVISRRLDRDRPLWEIWVIEGLSDNRWAMLTKIHHCMADGIAATHMLAGLCDPAANGIHDSFARRVGAAKQPKAQGILRVVSDVNPLKVLGGLWNASAAVAATTARTALGAAEIAAGLLRPAATSLNGPITNLRRYSAARVPLADVAQVCRAFDVSVNDVALAAITESYRNVLVQRGEHPQPDALRSLVPVSMRSVDAFDKTDNRVSVMLPYLPVEERNPVQRLRIVHSRLDRTKSHGQHQAGHALVSVANRIPFPLTAWAVRLLTRLPQRGVAILTTNVPGPREPLHFMGRRVLSVFPVPPIAMQLRTGVAMLSYADDLSFGILADYDAGADVDTLARGIEAAVARLVASSKRRKTARDRGGLTLVANV